MTIKLKPGDILMQGLTRPPQTVTIDSEPYAHEWVRVKNLDSMALNLILKKAGWNFFYIAEEMSARAFGSDEEKTARQAIRKLIARTSAKNLNSLEITQMVRKRFLGLPSLTITAHSRHIQKGIVLFKD